MRSLANMARSFPTIPVMLLALVALTSSAAAQPGGAAAAGQRAEIIKAALSRSALPAGGKATAAVVLKIKDGYHAQSHTPSQEYLIAFMVSVDENDAMTFGEAIYPPGEDHEYPALGKLNVYTGRVIVRVPIEVKADAKPGPAKITGKLRYQICDDRVCYPPQNTPFEIETEVVPAGTGTKLNEPELFEEEEGKEQPTTAPATTPPSSGGSRPLKIWGYDLNATDYALAFFAAFCVGMIFNIVPCVLPVLPLKAIGFYEVSQHNRAKCLAFGAVFSLGVIASFAVLGLLVVVLRVFKWGELFSNPWFAGALVVILVLMAFSMFGAFTVNVPRSLYAVTPRHDTYVGNFLFGILTAALSTPCTFGMFVGLLTWALAQPTTIGMLLMVTVGAGMAFPYFVLSAFPELARRFPRSGRWAELVKQMMGFLLLAVAAFFAQAWIARLTGPLTFWWVLFAIIAAAAAFLVVRTFQFSPAARPRLISSAVALVLAASAFVAVRQLTVKPYEWQPYSPAALAQARAGNDVVLVEFTANWCTNCHTLEALVLNRKSVVRTVDRYDVTMMKADLSAEDAPGWALLGELNESGVPLTVIYSPGTAEPIRLTGIYSVSDLQSAIERAAKVEPESAGPTAAAVLD